MEPQSSAQLREQAIRLNLENDRAGALRLRLELELRLNELGATVVEQTSNLSWIAFFAVCTGNLGEAERAARRCVDLYRPQARGDRDERWATYLMMLADILAEREKFEDAVPYAEAAVAIFAANHGEDSAFVQGRRRDVRRMRARDLGQYLDR
jgi:hypothetical protein